MIWLLIGLLLISMAACYGIAKSRSADTKFWLVMGILFGPLAVPFAFFSKPRR